ncbi:MAG: YtxH domain-containing protein [Candidatus Berkelbacteria bacterium]
MDKQSKGVMIGATVGILAGAIAGILLAPKSGEETRADISEYVTEMKNKIAAELAKVGEVTKEVYSDVVEKIVKVYELEKKITAKDAKDLKDKLGKNFEEVKKVIKK